MKKKIKTVKKKDLPLLKRALNLDESKNVIEDRNTWLEYGKKLHGELLGPKEPELQYIKIPIIGDRTPEHLSERISDLLCWFEGLEFGTPEEKQSKLNMARSGINAIRDIQVYLKNPIK